MNRLRVIAATSALCVAIVGGWAWGGIEGSKHDFSHEDWSGGNTCGACHTPETGTAPTAAPLWDPRADLNRTFGTPLAQSKTAGLGTVMCLRCHDGTIARDTFSNVGRERFVNKDHPGVFTTGHGDGNHPVGVDYPRFDKGFRPMASVVATATVALPSGKVECISCHDPHSMVDLPYMLVTSNARSALCLTCHRK